MVSQLSSLLPEEQVHSLWDAGELTYPDLLEHKRQLLQLEEPEEPEEIVPIAIEIQELQTATSVKVGERIQPKEKEKSPEKPLNRWKFIKIVEDRDDPYGKRRLKIMKSPDGRIVPFRIR